LPAKYKLLSHNFTFRYVRFSYGATGAGTGAGPGTGTGATYDCLVIPGAKSTGGMSLIEPGVIQNFFNANDLLNYRIISQGISIKVSEFCGSGVLLSTYVPTIATAKQICSK
jgi:hypothetical protein